MPTYLGETVSQGFLDMLTTVYKGGYVAMHPLHTPPIESDATLISQMEAALVRGGPDADLLARSPFFIAPASVAYARLVKADDAVAHWPLSETTGTTATDVIGGNNGTISGGVTLGVPGPVPGSTAMSFNGTTGYIGVPDGAYKQFGTGPATVECWIKESVAPTFDYPVDLKNDGDTSVAGLGIQGNATHIHCEVGPGAAGAIILATASNMLNGQWHHVVAVIERSATDRVHLYVDGVLKASQNLTANGWNLSSGRPMAIARAGDTAVNFYNGLVDEVAIYKVALTPAQVKAHYDARIPRTVY